jgi:hypothetical protein
MGYLLPPTRRLIESVAAHCGDVWDGLLVRLRGRSTI